jgi:FAD/FMN-containing dehydrogenase
VPHALHLDPLRRGTANALGIQLDPHGVFNPGRMYEWL